MTLPEVLLLCLPGEQATDATACAVSEGAISWSGRESDLADRFDADALAVMPVILIVPASRATFRRVAARGLEPKQELAVARISAAEDAIGTVRAAASFDADGRVALATVDQDWLKAEIDRLINAGFNVIAAVPAGALLQPPASTLWRGELAGERILFGADLACVEEPELAKLLFGALVITDVGADQVEQALVATSQTRTPDFMDGWRFRATSKPLFDNDSRIWAKRLALLALFLLFAAVVAHWIRLEWAISRENNRALAAAQQIDPAIADIAGAEAAVDAALARKGIQRGQPSMLVAIVWQAVRANENVALTNVALQAGGLLNATLAAPDAASANAALIAIQKSGYRITAKPRQDQSGMTLVDLTVRAP